MMAVHLPTQNLCCSSNALAMPYFDPRKVYLSSPKVNFWSKTRKGAVCSISSDQNPSNNLVRKRKIVEHICLLKAKKDLSEEEEKDMLDYLYTSQYHMGGIVAISLGSQAACYTSLPSMNCNDLLYLDFESEVEDDILAIFRKGEEFNYGVEFVLLIKFIDSALNGPAADALTSLANLAAEFPSLIVQSTQGCNFNPRNQEYTHGALIRFRSAEAQQIFLDSSEYKQLWISKLQPISQKTLSFQFHVDPVGTELM